VVVRIKDRIIYEGVASPSAIGSPVSVIDIPNQSEIYIIEGYIDLGNMEDGDQVTIEEQICVDGSNLRTYAKNTFLNAQDEPILRFHSKLLKNAYKVVLTQNAGSIKTFPYWFCQLIFEVV